MIKGMFDDDVPTTEGGEPEKGPLTYQESKVFNTELFLANIYDNVKARHVTFEIYGLDTQDMLSIGYSYQDFDGLFRFNAELMNPNRKEGRFHWVIERLAIVTVAGDRKLQLKPEPTEEVPQLPEYETKRKIPTGRMDLKERQRLREQMDMLDVKRAENISKKRAVHKAWFLRHIFKLKENHKAKQEQIEARLAEERNLRYQRKEESLRQEKIQKMKQADAEKKRLAKAEAKDTAAEQREEEDYRQLRARWKAKDEEVAAALEQTRQDKAKELEEQRQAETEKQEHLDELQQLRVGRWEEREERIKRKDAETLKQTFETKRELERAAQMVRERNSEKIQALHADRQPIFEKQLQNTEERRREAESEEEALSQHHAQRAIPKKTKTKGKHAAEKTDKSTPSGDEKEKSGKKKGKDKEKDKDKDKEAKEAEKKDAKAAEKENQKKSTDKVLDSVEAKMRAEMEEQQKRDSTDRLREERLKEKEEDRKEKELQRAKEYREAFRKKDAYSNEQSAERHLVMKERQHEKIEAEERKRQEMQRLTKVREQNILRREQQRLANLVAGATAA